MPYCKNCGGSINEADKFCSACGAENNTQNTGPEGHATEDSSYYGGQIDSSTPLQSNPYQKSLPEYYQQEFEMIRQSSENYKGKFNVAAFLGGALWAFYRGLYLPAIIAIAISFFTAGVGGVIYWFLFGVRGNWMLYNLYRKNRYLPF